jgi:hypothetical protein
MSSSKIQETLRRIREEAKRKTDEVRYGKPQPVTTQEVVTGVREQISTAVGKAISTKAARQYIGDIAERFQELATTALADSRSVTVNATNKDGPAILYPHNCKLLSQEDNGSGVLVIEEPPQLRTIFYGGDEDGYGEPKPYRIPLPYIVYVIGFYEQKGFYYLASFGVGFGTEPITSIETELLKPHLPHASNDSVCQYMKSSSFKTVTDLTDEVIQTFWGSAFHYDFNGSGCSFKVAGESINSIKDWENIKNPLDILKAKFSRGSKIKDVLANFGYALSCMSRTGRAEQAKIQIAVNTVLNGTREMSADELAKIIQRTAEEIVNVALQNVDSALQ